MKPLLELENRHPIVSTVIGATSGITSWLLANSGEITQFAGMIGAVCTAFIALLAVASKAYAFAVAIIGNVRARKRRVRK